MQILFFSGIYSQNCPEWIMTEQAAYCYSMVIVPLYDTLGANACAFIVNQSTYASYIHVTYLILEILNSNHLDHSPQTQPGYSLFVTITLSDS